MSATVTLLAPATTTPPPALGPTDTVSPLAAPNSTITVSDLLP